MLKKIAVTAAAALCLCIGVYAAEDIEITDKGINVDGSSYTFEDSPFLNSGAAYVPLDEAMPIFGYELGWDNNLKGTICRRENAPDSIIFQNGDTQLIGYNMYSYPHPTINIDGKCFVDSALLADLTGARVHTGRSFGKMSIIPDAYRIKEESLEKYPECWVMNRRYTFKPTAIDAESTEYYAAIVNMIAEKLSGVNVYNMLVPDAGEFYLPKEYYCGQAEAFEAVYSKLSDKVTPVRVVENLYQHAGEDIYFKTDHHWTQRGAYYAWQSFMNVKGEDVPALWKFGRVESDNFKGSFATELAQYSAESALDSATESRELFMPIYAVGAKVYNDMRMTDFAADIPVVNTENDTYGCFLYGDCPVTVVSSDINNGKSLVIMKESMGNALATWAVNNYEKTYVIDIRAFRDGSFDISKFYDMTNFDDLLIESYPTTIESADLRSGLMSLMGNN